MANLVTTEANAILAASSGQAPYVAPVLPVQIALVTATGTATAAGTEVVGGGYLRQTITFAPPAGGTISSNVAVTFVNLPACTLTGVDEFDSATPPVRRWFGNLSSPKTINAGDTFSISTGSYTKQLS